MCLDIIAQLADQSVLTNALIVSYEFQLVRNRQFARGTLNEC